MRVSGYLACLILTFGGTASAEPAKPVGRAVLEARLKAHQGDFDYLLGDWVFTAKSRQYGAYRGLWSAVRLEGGQILDEFRAMAEDNSTYGVTTTVRAYDPTLDRWSLVSLSRQGGLKDLGHARVRDGEVLIRQRLGAPHAALWRIRYHAITSDHFLWNGDRSTDGGKTWRRDDLVLDARRLGPPRPLLRLTPEALPPISAPFPDTKDACPAETGDTPRRTPCL